MQRFSNATHSTKKWKAGGEGGVRGISAGLPGTGPAATAAPCHCQATFDPAYRVLAKKGHRTTRANDFF